MDPRNSEMTLEFQAFAWEVGDTESEDVVDSEFNVRVFGKTRDGRSVALNVSGTEGYRPSFCIAVPLHLASEEYHDELSECLRKHALVIYDHENCAEGEIPERIAELSDHLLEPAEKIMKGASLWGFTNMEKVPFFRFEFSSLKAYKMILSKFRACHANKLSIDDMEQFCEEHSKMKKYAEKQAYIHDFHEDTGASENLLRWITKLYAAGIPLEFGQVKIFEHVDHILRFAHVKNLRLAGWMSVSRYQVAAERQTVCSLEISAGYEDIVLVNDNAICPTLKEMAFDIECYSHDDAFPDPTDIRNCVFQIGVTFKHYSRPLSEMRKILLHLRSPVSLRKLNSGVCRPIENAEVITFDRENDLLLYFSGLIRDEDPDALYTWNGDSFDWSYLMKRAEVLGCISDFAELSRLRNHRCTIEKETFSSSAQGDNQYERVHIPGRLNIDAMVWVKRNMGERFADLKLDTVAAQEIGEQKRDVHYKRIFAAFRTGDEDECSVIGDYCCQDTALVQKLALKLDMLTQLFEMSNITMTPVAYLMQKGQQIKVFSLIAKKAREKGFFIPLADERNSGSFSGGAVLEPTKGVLDTPTVGLDFASLYPSIQVAYGICYTTLVLVQCPPCKAGREPEACLRNEGIPCYDNIPGIEYETVSFDETILICSGENGHTRKFPDIDVASAITGDPKRIIKAALSGISDSGERRWRQETVHHRYRFAQNVPSVIPDLQVELKKDRKAVRRLQAMIKDSDDPEDQLNYRVLNGRQLAIKVSMNSIYGFTSAFMLNMRVLSACVCALGRQMISRCVTFMENEFEEIGRTTLWTEAEERAYFTPDGREVYKSPDSDAEPGWKRKYHTAVAGSPWVVGKSLSLRIVGGDTDSVFCNFPESTLLEAISLAHKAAEVLTSKIFNRPPIEMEYEKTWLPMVIQAKKAYAGVKYEMDDSRWEVDSKGIAVKRRNYCPLAKDALWQVAYPTLGLKVGEGGKLQQVHWTPGERHAMALKALEGSLFPLVNGTVPLDDLIITSSLRSHYANENLPHVQLAKRINEREKGGGPRPGQRFGYIYVHETQAADHTAWIPEDPTFVRDKHLVPNGLYYLNNQIRKPLTTFMRLLGREHEAIDVFDSVEKSIRERISKRRRSQELQARKDLLSGKQTAVVKQIKKPVRKAAPKDAGCRKMTSYFAPQSCASPVAAPSICKAPKQDPTKDCKSIMAYFARV